MEFSITINSTTETNFSWHQCIVLTSGHLSIREEHSLFHQYNGNYFFCTFHRTDGIIHFLKSRGFCFVHLTHYSYFKSGYSFCMLTCYAMGCATLTIYSTLVTWLLVTYSTCTWKVTLTRKCTGSLQKGDGQARKIKI